jgi:hypothetical protein
VAKNEVVTHLFTPQVDISVLETKVLINITLLLYAERRRLGPVEDLNACDIDFDLTCGKLRIDSLGRTPNHLPPDLEYILGP